MNVYPAGVKADESSIMHSVASDDLAADAVSDVISPVASVMRFRPTSGLSSSPRVLIMPEFMSIGGGQKHFLRKALWLKRNGVFVAVASAGGVMESELADAGIPHLTLNTLGAQGAYVNCWDSWGDDISTLLDFVDRHQITVLNAHPIVPILAAREVARHRDVGVAYEFLGGQTHLIPSDVWIDEVFKGNFYTGRGPIGAQIQDRLHFDEELIAKIPWPVDVKPFQTAPETTLRDELGLPNDAFIVLNACRHDHDKLVHIYGLVDSMQRLMPDHPNLHVVFAGDGTEHAALTQYVRDRLPDDRTHILGMYADMNAALHGCDALYGMGSVCFEASIAKKPVLVAPTTTLMGTPGAFPANEMTIGYFREYDFHTIGDVVDGVRYSTIDERLTPLIESLDQAVKVAQNAHDIVVSEHHIDRVMEQWLVEYQRRHDAALARRMIAVEGASSNDLYPTRDIAVQRDEMSAILIESVFGAASLDVELALTAEDGSRRIRVALAVPHDPGAVVPPHARWAELIEPLAELGVDAKIVLTPDNAAHFGDVDVVVVTSMMHGSTFQRWADVNAYGKPVLLVGEYRDERAWRELWRIMPSILSGEPSEAVSALQNLREHRIRVADGSDPMETITSAGQRELAHAHMLQSVAEYLTGSDEESQQLQRSTGTVVADRWFAQWAQPLPDGNADRFCEEYGVRDFTLCVGTVDAAGNQATLALALYDSDRPLVLLGPPDPEYQYVCRRFNADNLIFIPYFDDQLFADAVAGAAVVVDASLHTGDTTRIAQAAALGKPVAVSERVATSALGGQCVRFDPLNPEAIAAAIARALELEQGGALPSAPPTRKAAARYLARAIYSHTQVLHNSVNVYDRTVAMVVGDSREMLLDVLTALSERDEPDVEYLFVDNASSDGTAALLAQLDGDVQVHRLDDAMEFETCAMLARHSSRSENIFLIDLNSVESAANVIELLDGRNRPAA